METFLKHQVAGHVGGLLTTDDGSLIIKSALPLELDFYQNHATTAEFEPLRPFLPQFFGTLRLEGEHDTTQPGTLAVKPLPEGFAQERDKSTNLCQSRLLRLLTLSPFTQSIVLQNLAHTFVRPNIVDIKLGTILYDESATPEKRARMIERARDTTSLETGMRITGFQVCAFKHAHHPRHSNYSRCTIMRV